MYEVLVLTRYPYGIVGVNFAVLITWTMISCISLPLIQWFVRRQDIAVARGAKEVEMIPRSEDKEISA